MSTIIYARASSDKQTTESQKPDLKRWEAANGPAVWFEEIASGTTMNRAEWNKVEEHIDAGKVKTLVVWRLDRLGRSASGLVKLFEKLAKKGVNLVSIKDGIDLSTPAGRLIANVLASVAAYENEVRRERTLAGQAAARERGVTWGGSEAGRVAKKTQKATKKVLANYDLGVSILGLSKMFGLNRRTVYRILEDGGKIERGPDGKGWVTVDAAP